MTASLFFGNDLQREYSVDFNYLIKIIFSFVKKKKENVNKIKFQKEIYKYLQV